MRSDRSPLSFESIDPALNPDPDACTMWPKLRAEEPVAWVAPTERRRGFWVITKHEDVMAMSRSDRFSSAQGNMLGTLAIGGDPASEKMLVVTDPPRHSFVRGVMQPGFHDAKRPLQERLKAAAGELVVKAVEKGDCEFVSEVAAHLPLLTVCGLLGVPKEDQAKILELSMTALDEDGVQPTARAEGARHEVLAYFARLVAYRRGTPTEDLVSRMVSTKAGDEPLTDTEVALNCYNILVGGNETGRLSAASGVLALIEHPDEWEKLKGASQPPFDDAVQEILRWTTPTTYLGRVAVEDTMVRERLISKDDIVTLWIVSANRDEEVFDHPYEFDISRRPNKHLTFGRGRHTCLGAQIGRIGLKALLRALREHVSTMELTGPPGRMDSTLLAGVSKLPVRFAPA